jgi:hypothetical protein
MGDWREAWALLLGNKNWSGESYQPISRPKVRRRDAGRNAPAMRIDHFGNKSGRNSWQVIFPSVANDTAKTRSGGTRRHADTACL